MTTASYRAKVPPLIKRRLFEQAGKKCANPGCPTTRVEFHHIKQWHVYGTHEEANMIAVCPTCHDAIHHSKTLKLTDEMLLEWKAIKRPPGIGRAYVYVEPAQDVRLRVGAFELVLGKKSASFPVFNLSPANRLSFRIQNEEIIDFECHLSDMQGVEVASTVANHVRVTDREGVALLQVPGRIQVLVPATAEFYPEWVLGNMRTKTPGLINANGQTVAMEVRVIEPGCVQVNGHFATNDNAYALFPNQLFISNRLGRFSTFAAYGDPKDPPPRILLRGWTGDVQGDFLDFLCERMKAQQAR